MKEVQHQNGVGLSPPQLQVIFPYHIATDPMFHVIQVGIGLTNLFENKSEIVGSHISDCFDMATPFGCNWDWESMISNKEATFEFCLKERLLPKLKRHELKELSLRGSILLQPDNDGAIFLLHLNISNTNELKNNGFQMTDISPFSMQKDLLLVADRFHSKFTVAKQVELKQQILKLQALETETTKVKSMLDSKKAFIRYISHELRNPLNISLLGLNLLEEQLVDSHTTLTSSKSSKSNKQSRSNSSKSNHGINNSSKSSNVSNKGTGTATTTAANHDGDDKSSPSTVEGHNIRNTNHSHNSSGNTTTATTTKAITNANTRANSIKSPTRFSSERNSSNQSFIDFNNDGNDNNNNKFSSTPNDTCPTSTTSTPTALVATTATTTTISPEKILLLELISDIKNSNMMAVEILNDLLLYEKIDNNEFHMNVVEMKPYKLITNVVKLFTPDAKRSNIQLIRKDTENIENVYIQADIVQISQVLRNLLSNALKFTPSGGQVTVSTEIIESSSTQQLSSSSSKLTLGKESNNICNDNIRSNSNNDEKENMNADNVNVSSKSAKKRIIANNTTLTTANVTNNNTNAMNISSSDYDSTASSSKNINSTSITSSSSSKKASKLREDLLYAQSYMYENNSNTVNICNNSDGIAMNSLDDNHNVTNNVMNAAATDDNKNIQQQSPVAPSASQVQQKVSPLSQHSTSPQKQQQQQLSQSQRSPSPQQQQQLSRLRRSPQPTRLNNNPQQLLSLSDSPDSHSSAVSRNSTSRDNTTIQQNTIIITANVTNNNLTTGSNKLFNKHANNIFSSSSAAPGLTKFSLLSQNTNYSIAEAHIEKDSDESNSNSKSNSNSNSNTNSNKNNSNTKSNEKSNYSGASHNSNASSNKINTVDEDYGNYISINNDNMNANNNTIDTSTATNIAPTSTVTTTMTTARTATASTPIATTFGGWWKISSLLSSIIPSSSQSLSLSNSVSHTNLNNADNNNTNSNNTTVNTVANDNISPLRSIPNNIKATSLYSSRYINTNSFRSHTNKSMTTSASSASFLSGTTTAISADTNTINSTNNKSSIRIDSVNSTAKNSDKSSTAKNSDKSSVAVKHTSDDTNSTNTNNRNSNTNNISYSDDRPTASTAVTNDLPYWYSSIGGDDLPVVTITPPHSSKTLLLLNDHHLLNSDVVITATAADVLQLYQERQSQNNICGGDEVSVVNRSQSLLPVVDSTSSSHAFIALSQSHSPSLPLPSYSLLPPQSLIQQQQSLLPSLSPVTATTAAESRKTALLLRSPSNIHINNRSPSPTTTTSTSHNIHHYNNNSNNNFSHTKIGSSNSSNNNSLPITVPHSNSPTRQTRVSGHYTVNSHYNYSNNSTKNNNSSSNFNSASSNNYYSSDKSLLSNAISLKPISVAAAAESSGKSNMTQDNKSTDFRNSDHSNRSGYGITNNTANYNNNANNSNSNFSDKSYSLSSQKNNHSVFEISSSTSAKNNNNTTQLHNNNSSANTDSNQYIDLSFNDEESNIRKNQNNNSFIKSSSFYISNANSNTNSNSNSSKLKDGDFADSTTASTSFVLRISVSDTGRGLSKTTQKALFEEYSHCRTSSSSSSAAFVVSPKINSSVTASFPSRDRGSGLGLWVSRNIVEAHNGSIGVYSEGENIGKGSTFYIDIPVFKVVEKNEYDNISGKSMIHNTSSKSLKSQNASSKILQSQKYDQNENDALLNLGQNIRISPLSIVLQNLDINNDELQSTHENANSQTKTARSNNNSRSTSASRNVNKNNNNSSKNSYHTSSSSSNSVVSNSHHQQQQYHNNSQLQISSVTPRCLQSILIVDDDKLCRKMIHHSITRLSNNTNNKSTSANSKSINNTSSNQNTSRTEYPSIGSFSSAVADSINNTIDNLKDIDSKTTTAISVNDGADAIEKYNNSISGAEGTFPYDVIMMDFVMPVMDGPTSTQQLRALGYKGLIVGVTGNSLPSDVELFLESGANKVMIKPLDINKFMTYATTWIQRLA